MLHICLLLVYIKTRAMYYIHCLLIQKQFTLPWKKSDLATFLFSSSFCDKLLKNHHLLTSVLDKAPHAVWLPPKFIKLIPLKIMHVLKHSCHFKEPLAPHIVPSLLSLSSYFSPLLRHSDVGLPSSFPYRSLNGLFLCKFSQSHPHHFSRAFSSVITKNLE